MHGKLDISRPNRIEIETAHVLSIKTLMCFPTMSCKKDFKVKYAAQISKKFICCCASRDCHGPPVEMFSIVPPPPHPFREASEVSVQAIGEGWT